MPRIPIKDDAGYLFIVNTFIKTGRAPTFQAIADKLGYASKRSVQLMVKRLADAGRITYTDGRIGLVTGGPAGGQERTVPVPIVGAASCGPLMLAEENIEEQIDVSTVLAKPGYRYFILRAKGQSMNKAGIDDGDLVLVRQQATANNGDRVVALVDDEATIKVYRRQGAFVMLTPESTDPTIKPVILSHDFIIQGVVVTTLPNPF